MTIIKHADHECDDASAHDAGHCYLNAHERFERTLEFPNSPREVDRKITLTADWIADQGAYALKTNGMFKGWYDTAQDAWAWVNS